MTYGMDPSPETDLSKHQPRSDAQVYGQPDAYGQAAVPGYGEQPAAYGAPPAAAYAHQTSVPSAGPVGDIEIRPSKEQYQSFLAKTPVAFVAIVVILWFREGVLGVVVGLVAGVIALGAVMLYISRARLRMDHLSVTRRGLVGSKTFARADLGQVVLAPYQATSTDPRVALTLIALDRQGKRVLRLGSALWRPADLEGLAHTMGPAPVVYSDVLNPKTLTERHPGAVSWAERHPFLLGGIIAVALIAVIVVAVIAFS